MTRLGVELGAKQACGPKEESTHRPTGLQAGAAEPAELHCGLPHFLRTFPHTTVTLINVKLLCE
jgi:hypothetical protein